MKIAFRQLAGFLFVGGISAGLDFGIFVFLIALHVPPVFATALSFLLSSIFNYWANRSLVFRTSGLGTIVRYVVLVAVNAGLSSGLVALGILVGLHPVVAKGLSMVVIVLFNFVMMKRWVFRARRPDHQRGETAAQSGT